MASYNTVYSKKPKVLQYIDEIFDLPLKAMYFLLLQVPPFWPIQGAIYFHRVCLRYRPNLPLALNDVTFETHPHEKIGIVGRTGSGKSSLFLALFQMVEIQSGNILIDGINLNHLDLQELRLELSSRCLSFKLCAHHCYCGVLARRSLYP